MSTNSNDRILIIDDNPAIHEDLRKILGGAAPQPSGLDEAETALFGEPAVRQEQVEFAIDSAYQGREGLEMIRKSLAENAPYALAFVDVRMPPGWDGVETISHLWKEYPELQVVICTAYSDYSWEEILRQLGRTDNLVILKKPFDNIEVLQLAYALTRKWELNQEAKSRLENLDRVVGQRTSELQAANDQLAREVTQRRQAEEELRLSEERFSKAFHSSPIPMTICLLHEECCLDANHRFLDMVGYGSSEVLGRSLSELGVFADAAQWASIRQELQQSKSVRNVECALRDKPGKTREARLWSELIDIGTERCLLLILEDVTERRAMEAHLRQAQKMEAIGRLAAGVAHDFNNLLTIIQGHAGLLRLRGKGDATTLKSIEQISQASERAAGLTRQLLTFSRKQLVQPKVFDLNRRVEGLREMLGRLLGEQVQLACCYAEDLPPINADPVSIEQIVLNLVVNARDAMPKGGRVMLRTELVEVDAAHQHRCAEARPGSHICLTVTDTGCGMTAEVMERIFEPFFTSKASGKGTGLGLATVYGIAKQHNGWIEVSSQVGHGTTFKVFLPPSDQPETEVPVKAETYGPEDSPALILVVEDEPSVRGLACTMLTTAGYQTLEAADGMEAIEVWKQHAPKIDLVFTDVVMPNGIHGAELARRLRAERPDVKVVFTSGYSAALASHDSPLRNGDVFLPKPYETNRLLTTLRECLRRPVRFAMNAAATASSGTRSAMFMDGAAGSVQTA